jgi:putative salt-induced outer membrane protein
MKKILLTSVVAATVALSAQAADKTKEVVTHTELGYIQTNGNTKTKTFNLDAKAERQWEKHIGILTIDGQYGSDQGETTKKKYLIEAEYNYAFTDRLAFSYLAGYKYDEFSGFDYQAYTGPGIKYAAIKQATQNLSVEASALYSEDKYAETGDTNDYASYRLKGEYDLQITDNLKFTQELSVRGSFEESDNYFAFSKTAFTSKLSDIFSAGVSYKLDYVNIPAASYKTDETLTFNLIMDY